MSALGHTEPLAAQGERLLSAEVRPWRGRRDRFGACWPRLRVQRRAPRATADRDEHWRANGGARRVTNSRLDGGSYVLVSKDRHGGDPDSQRLTRRRGRSTGVLVKK